jgi:hypothetical protein
LVQGHVGQGHPTREYPLQIHAELALEKTTEGDVPLVRAREEHEEKAGLSASKCRPIEKERKER